MTRHVRTLIVAGLASAVAGCGSSHPTPAGVSPATRGVSHVGPDTSAWRVAAPIIGSPSEPPPFIAKQCRAGQMHATATTRRTADGVVGVVTIVGSKVHTRFGHRACSPAYGHGPRTLLDASGKRLEVTSVEGNVKTNPPGTFPSAIGVSPQVWGFSWRGSWCGPQAVSVVMPRGSSRDADAANPRLVVRLHGPQPACHDASHSTLAPGIAGFTHEPVEAPPPAWSALRARLHVPRLRRDVRIGGLSVTLHDPTAHSIALSPCPTYRIGLSRVHSGEMTGPMELSCTRSTAIPAGGSLRIPLDFHAAPPTHVGRMLRFTFAMAGFPSANAHGRVRR